MRVGFLLEVVFLISRAVMSLSRINVAAVRTRALRKGQNDGGTWCRVDGEEDGNDDNTKGLPVAQKTTMGYLSGARVLRTD